MSQIDRREFLRLVGVGTVAGAAILAGCAGGKTETSSEPTFGEEIPQQWSTIDVPLNRTVRLQIKQLQPEETGLTDLFIYSNSNEAWAWFTPVFQSQVYPGYADFYLAKYTENFDPNDKALGYPRTEDVPEDSFLNAFGDLNQRYSEVIEGLIGGKSVVLALEKPQDKEPYVLVYKARTEDSIGFVPLKLIFEPSESGAV